MRRINASWALLASLISLGFLCGLALGQDLGTYENFNISFDYPSKWKIQSEKGNSSLGNVTIYTQTIAQSKIILNTIVVSWVKGDLGNNTEAIANYVVLLLKADGNFTDFKVIDDSPLQIDGTYAASRVIDCVNLYGYPHTFRFAGYVSPESKRLITVSTLSLKSQDDEVTFRRITDTLKDSTTNRPPGTIGLEADKQSVQQSGTDVTWKAKASDPDGDTVLYKFLVKGPASNNNWSEKTDWSSANKWTWRTDERDIGENQIAVWVKDDSGDEKTESGGYDNYKIETFVIEERALDHKPQVHSLKSDRPSPQKAGTPITWATSATDIVNNVIYYKYWLIGPSTGGNWSPMTEWITDSTWTWNTTDSDIGENQVRVWVRDGSYAGEDSYDNSMSSEFVIEKRSSPPSNPNPEPLNYSPSIPTKTEWEKKFGEAGFDVGYYVLSTGDSGYLMTGSTESEGSGDRDLLMQKVNPGGNVDWKKVLGGSGRDEGRSIIGTDDEGHIIAGYTRSYGAGGSDVWLIKVDANGEVNWDRTFGGPEDDEAYSIVKTTDGDYLVAGYTSSFGNGGKDLWVLKINSKGNMEWNKTFGMGGDEEGRYLMSTKDGGCLITGYTKSKGLGGKDIWVLKLDPEGNEEWENVFGIQKKAAGRPNDDIGSGVLECANGGYLLVGTGKDDGNANADLWLVKMDFNGTKEWDKCFGGSKDDHGNAIISTKDEDGYMLSGSTKSLGGGGYDAWLIRTDSGGDEVWNRTMGGSLDDQALSVVATNDGGFLLVGLRDGNRYSSGTWQEGDAWMDKEK